MSKKVGMRGLVFVQNPRSAGGLVIPGSFSAQAVHPNAITCRTRHSRILAGEAREALSRERKTQPALSTGLPEWCEHYKDPTWSPGKVARDLTPAARFMPRPAATHP